MLLRFSPLDIRAMPPKILRAGRSPSFPPKTRKPQIDDSLCNPYHAHHN